MGRGPPSSTRTDTRVPYTTLFRSFWSSVMLTTGRYKGSPVAEHLKHKARITPAMFDRWLAIWAATTDELMAPAAAAALQAKAARIAESLQLALFFRLRSEEHTSELQSLMRISYAVFCLKKK